MCRPPPNLKIHRWPLAHLNHAVRHSLGRRPFPDGPIPAFACLLRWGPFKNFFTCLLPCLPLSFCPALSRRDSLSPPSPSLCSSQALRVALLCQQLSPSQLVDPISSVSSFQDLGLRWLRQPAPLAPSLPARPANQLRQLPALSARGPRPPPSARMVRRLTSAPSARSAQSVPSAPSARCGVSGLAADQLRQFRHGWPRQRHRL